MSYLIFLSSLVLLVPLVSFSSQSPDFLKGGDQLGSPQTSFEGHLLTSQDVTDAGRFRHSGAQGGTYLASCFLTPCRFLSPSAILGASPFLPFLLCLFLRCVWAAFRPRASSPQAALKVGPVFAGLRNNCRIIQVNVADWFENLGVLTSPAFVC